MTLPPCGHGNGTHPSDCWWPAAMEMAAEARAPLEEEIAALRAALDGLIAAARETVRSAILVEIGPDTEVWSVHSASLASLRLALAAAKETP